MAFRATFQRYLNLGAWLAQRLVEATPTPAQCVDLGTTYTSTLNTNMARVQEAMDRQAELEEALYEEKGGVTLY